MKQGVHVPSCYSQIIISHFKKVEPALYAYDLSLLKKLAKDPYTFEDEHFIFLSLFHEFGHYIDFKRNFACDNIAFNIHYENDFKKRNEICKLGLDKMENQIKYNEELALEKYANTIAMELLLKYIFI